MSDDDPKKATRTSSLLNILRNFKKRKGCGEALRLSNQDFSFSLYKEFAKNETGNIFYSTFSIHLDMFMASLGAASETFDEIIATIHLKKTDHSLVAYKDLLKSLTCKNDNLEFVVGMFIDAVFTVQHSFIENSVKYLDTSIKKLNFKIDPEQQRQCLNSWVLDKTNKKIKDLFTKDSINKDTDLVLANAMHFKCAWEYNFDDVENGFFYVIPCNKVEVKMMTLEKDLQYYHDSAHKFAALELPYENYAYKMIILLPDDKNGLKDLENNFSNIKLDDILNKMTDHHVTVKLPSFELEQSLILDEIISNLGCPTMFTPTANFSKFIKGGGFVQVNKVVHKAYVVVDEKGTLSPEVSGSFSESTEVKPELVNVNFHADHPFVFVILSRGNIVLFQGRLSTP